MLGLDFKGLMSYCGVLWFAFLKNLSHVHQTAGIKFLENEIHKWIHLGSPNAWKTESKWVALHLACGLFVLH